jgi:hypothetical protein
MVLEPENRMFEQLKVRRRVAIPATASLLVIGVAATPGPKPVCQVAAEWVEAHRSNLPNSLEKFAELSPAYEKAVFVALPLADQQRLWREHLQKVLDTATTLTVPQRQIVGTVLARLPELFSPELSLAVRRARATLLTPQIRAAFPEKKAAYLILMSLGGDRRAPVQRASGFKTASLLPTALFAKFTNKKKFADCECNVSWQDCFTGICIDEGTDRCGNTEQGCGPVHLATCDGMCQF